MRRLLALLLLVGEGALALTDTPADTFMEVEVSPRDPYVQQRTHYTLRLFRDGLLTQGAFIDPADPEAVWLLVDERPPVAVEREGRGYRMTERRYLLLPQRSGRIELTGPAFSGPSDHARAPKVTLTVKPRPADWGEAPWLPAERMTVRERWENPPAPWRVGDQLTRILTLEARGLTGAQLPPFPLPEMEGLEARRGRVVNEQRIEEGALVGRRGERQTLTVRREGTYLLPPTYVKWWSLEEARARVALLRGAELSFVFAVDEVVVPQQREMVDQGERRAAPEHSWWWLLVLPPLMLLHPLARWSARRLNRRLELNAARRAFITACQRGDPRGAAEALRRWGVLLGTPVHTLVALGETLADPAASTALRALDAALYGGEGEAWDGEACCRVLPAAMKRIRMSRKLSPRPPLPPL